MELTPVNSSNVKAIGYSGTTLTVQFSSGTYDYFDVSDEKWQAIQNCISEQRSLGTYISANIVRAHKHRKHEG